MKDWLIKLRTFLNANPNRTKVEFIDLGAKSRFALTVNNFAMVNQKAQ